MSDSNRAGEARDGDAVTPYNIPQGSTVYEIYLNLLRRDTGHRDDLRLLLETLHANQSIYDHAIAIPQFGPGYDSLTSRRRRIQDHWAGGGSIMDLFDDNVECMDAVGMTWGQYVACFTAKSPAAHPSRVGLWGHKQWLRFESALLDHEHPSAALARELDVHRPTLTHMMEFYYEAADQVRRRT